MNDIYHNEIVDTNCYLVKKMKSEDQYKSWQIPEYTKHEFKNKASDYCIVIPVLNEEGRIDVQLKRMNKVIPNVDIIICDGGSVDACSDPEYFRKLNVRTLLIKTGIGRMSSQQRILFAYALREGYQGIVNVDGNNKDGIEVIPQYISLMKNKGYDCVYGSRFLKEGHHENTPFERLLAIRLFQAPLISLSAGFRYTDTTNSFRGYKREFLLDPRVKPFRNIFDNYNLPYYLAVRGPRLGYRVIEIPVSRIYPNRGKLVTKISGIKAKFEIIKETVMAILGFYNPLRKEPYD